MQLLKQSTAVSVLVGPVLDSAGAAYTGMVIGDFNITKNGTSAAMAAAATATHDHNGHYVIALTTGNTDTLGQLSISCNKATYAMPAKSFSVLPAATFDALITNAAGAANGLLVAGSNAATTFASFTVSAAMTIEGGLAILKPAGTALEISGDSGVAIQSTSGVPFTIDSPGGAVIVNGTNITGTLSTVTTLTNYTSPPSAASIASATATQITTDHGAGSYTSSSGGSGANAVTVTVDDGTDPVENATVRVKSGGTTYVLTTDVNGVAAFSLDAATWTLTITASGFDTFTPESLIVTAATALTRSLTSVITTPSSPSDCTVYFIASRNGAIRAGVTFQFTCTTEPTGSGNVYLNDVRSAVSGVAGAVSIELPRSSTWSVTNSLTNRTFTVTVPDAASYEPANVLV
jgi:hypothetical protein